MLAILKQDSSVYIFDEPFNGLDLESNHILELIIRNLIVKKKTIFISSHILDPLKNLCNEYHYLENGEFIKSYNEDEYTLLEDFIKSNINTRFRDIVERSV